MASLPKGGVIMVAAAALGTYTHPVMVMPEDPIAVKILTACVAVLPVCVKHAAWPNVPLQKVGLLP